MKTFPDIDRLKTTLDHHRLLGQAVVRKMPEDLIVCWTQHSNVLAGNTLPPFPS